MNLYENGQTTISPFVGPDEEAERLESVDGDVAGEFDIYGGLEEVGATIANTDVEDDEETGLSDEDEESFDDEWETGPVEPEPRSVGAPFAPLPPASSFWPVKSTHPRRDEINYITVDGSQVGRNQARRFGAQRGSGARLHAAVDLYARKDDEVVACQAGRIVNFYGFCCGSRKTSYALLVDHGDLVINYAEVSPDSLSRLGLGIGNMVTAGQTIGYIGVNPGGSSMLHFETYTPGTRSNKRWEAGKSPPREVLDPTKYLLALRSGGGAYHDPNATDPSARPSIARPTLRRGERGEAVRTLQDALRRAGFTVTVDGLFGPRTEGAVRQFQQARGVRVDGVVGPITWSALLGDGPATSGPEADATSGAASIQLGTLVLEAPGRPSFSYQFTPDDLVWSAKLLVHEAGGQDDADNAAVIWAMFNRFALFTHRVYPTFTAFIRAYSTTLQPVLRSSRAAARHHDKGDAVYRKTGGTYEGTQIPKGQLVRHLRIQAAPWSEVKQSARSVATRALRGELPNPGIGLASEFASTRIFFKQRHRREPNDQEFLEYTMALARSRNWEFVGEIAGINSRKNAFFLDSRAKGLPSSAVRVRPPGHGPEMEVWQEQDALGFEPAILSEEEFDEIRR